MSGTTYYPPSGESTPAAGEGVLDDGTVTNAKVAADAAIALSKLAVDPLARANHTGVQAIATTTGLQGALDGKAPLVARVSKTGLGDFDASIPSGTSNSGYFVAEKVTTSDDASLVLRSAGHTKAEVGLPGDNDLHIKVVTGATEDDLTFTDAIIVKNDTGAVQIATALGVGTATPSNPVHIADAETAARVLAKIENSAGSGSGSAGFLLTGRGKTWYIVTDIGLNGGDNIGFSSDTAGYPPRLMLTPTGVGVLNDGPATALDVSGAATLRNVAATPATPTAAGVVYVADGALSFRNAAGIAQVVTHIDPTAFGAVGDGIADDTAALTAAIAALRPGMTLLIPAGKIFTHTSVLTVATDGVSIRGPGELRATVQTSSSIHVTGDRVTVADVTLSLVPAHTARGDNLNHHKLIADDCTGFTARRVTVRDSYAAGIFMHTATDFLIEGCVVEDTAADGIHCTKASARGYISHCVTRNTGDDGVAVVSYSAPVDAAPCQDITSLGCRILGTVTGRGITIMGGQNIRHSDFYVENPFGCGALIGTEAENPGVVPENRGVDNAIIERGYIVGANTAAPGTDYGAIQIGAHAPDSEIHHATIRDITIRDTNPAASRQIGILTENGSVTGDLVIEDIRILGTGPANISSTTGTAAASYKLRGVRVGDDMEYLTTKAGVPGWSMFWAGNVETVPRFSLGAVASGSGVMRVVYFATPNDITITKLGLSVTDAVPDTLTMSRLGLFTAAADGSLTLVARTANDLTIGSAAWANISVALSATGGYPTGYTLLAGKWYALGFLQVGVATCGIRFAGVTNADTPPSFVRQIAGQTDILATYSVGDLAVSDQAMYMFATP